MKVDVTTDDVDLDDHSEYSMGSSKIVQKANKLYPDTAWSFKNLSQLLIRMMEEIEELRKQKGNNE